MNSEPITDAEKIVSYPYNVIAGAQQSATNVVSAAVTGVTPVDQIHVTADGDVLVTSAAAKGNDGEIVLEGAIGPFPYKIRLKVKFDPAHATVQVTLDMERPFDLPAYTWTFDLHGVVKDSSGNIIGASDVKLSPTNPAAELSFWCVLKCGGLAILGCLLKCLPALSGGPGAYVACVVSCAGAGAAGIAVCVAKKCL